MDYIFVFFFFPFLSLISAWVVGIVFVEMCIKIKILDRRIIMKFHVLDQKEGGGGGDMSLHP
ncbi:hypothetical protein LOK49_LG14G02040 [Camellia lanceoleosa]|uniref:Uncharacterized protein n=1 Tax=Camellia lanceoleosa TaxID=1840588 RepID=A0ACC0FBN1_9ERIC|nr:hypothetical protein LOK49_LG14G02040 [Camellia lanceoleosa]